MEHIEFYEAMIEAVARTGYSLEEVNMWPGENHADIVVSCDIGKLYTNQIFESNGTTFIGDFEPVDGEWPEYEG